MWTLAIIVFVIAIVVLLVKGIPELLQNKKELDVSIQSSMSPDERIIYKQTIGVSYLGGHPPFGSPSTNGGMVITDKRLSFFNVGDKRFFSIQYEDMIEMSTETTESLTALRVVLTGLLAPLWKKTRPFILIGMRNDIGETSRIGFGFEEPGLGSSFWPTSRWFQVISEQRYTWFKNKRTTR